MLDALDADLLAQGAAEDLELGAAQAGAHANAIYLEHANVTVKDLDQSIDFYSRLLDFEVRWRGNTSGGHRAAHVGSDRFYLALFEASQAGEVDHDYEAPGLNHVGFVVDDLDDKRARLADLGFETHLEGDYEPGRRLYFFDPSGLKVELVEFWLLMGSAFGAVLAGFEPRLVRGKTVPNQGMLSTLRTSLRAAALALPLGLAGLLDARQLGSPGRRPALDHRHDSAVGAGLGAAGAHSRARLPGARTAPQGLHTRKWRD